MTENGIPDHIKHFEDRPSHSEIKRKAIRDKKFETIRVKKLSDIKFDLPKNCKCPECGTVFDPEEFRDKR